MSSNINGAKVTPKISEKAQLSPARAAHEIIMARVASHAGVANGRRRMATEGEALGR